MERWLIPEVGVRRTQHILLLADEKSSIKTKLYMQSAGRHIVFDDLGLPIVWVYPSRSGVACPFRIPPHAASASVELTWAQLSGMVLADPQVLTDIPFMERVECNPTS
jgi:hypothetical protein